MSDKKNHIEEQFKNAVELAERVTETEKIEKYSPSIRKVFDGIKALSLSDLLYLLKERIGLSDDDISALKHIGMIDFVNLWMLAALLLWMDGVKKYKVVGVSLAEDSEKGDPLFVSIYVDKCGWEEWEEMSKTTKRQLVDEDLANIAGRVAIICKNFL